MKMENNDIIKHVDGGKQYKSTANTMHKSSKRRGSPVMSTKKKKKTKSPKAKRNKSKSPSVRRK